MCLCHSSVKAQRHSKTTTSSSVQSALPSVMLQGCVGRLYTMLYKFRPSGKRQTRISGHLTPRPGLFATSSSEPLLQMAWTRARLASYLSWSFMSKLETRAHRSPRCLAAGVSLDLTSSRRRGSTTSRFTAVAPPQRRRFEQQTSGPTEAASRPCRRRLLAESSSALLWR